MAEPTESTTTTTATPPAAGAPPAPPAPPTQGFRGTATGEPLLDDDDDELDAKPVVGRGGQPMESEAISERVARSQRRLLRQHYGTDDPAKIEEIRRQAKEREDRLAKLEAEAAERQKKEEESKRAAMTREEQLAADLAKKEAQIEALKTQVSQAQTENLTNQQEQIITRVALKYVDETMLDAARFVFAKHVRGLSKVEQRRFNDKRLDSWFAKFVKDNPRYAREASKPAVDGTTPDDKAATAGASKETPKPPPRRVPVGHARPAAKPQPRPAGNDPNASPNGKTVRPGLPNSMNKKELNAELRRQGIRPW